MQIEIPDELVDAMKGSLQCLHDAIEAEKNPEKQIHYRKMAAIGNNDSTPEGAFQVIIEICVKPEFFIPDGVIQIITDRQFAFYPYKTTPAKS